MCRKHKKDKAEVEIYNFYMRILYKFTKINKMLDFLTDTDYHEDNKSACTCTQKRQVSLDAESNRVFGMRFPGICLSADSVTDCFRMEG